MEKSGSASKRLNVGMPNAGVPQNTMRKATARLPFAGFGQFADFALDKIALERAEMIDEKNSVKVVDFMAEGAGEKTFTFHLKFLAGGVLGADGDVERTQNISAKTRDGEAALLLALLAFGVENDGIGEDELGFGIFARSDVDDGQIQIEANLRGGKADALRGVHGLEHFVRELDEGVVEFLDIPRGFFQNGGAEFCDRMDHSLLS